MMKKKIISIFTVSSAVFLTGCAQTTYWVKQGGTTEEFDRVQAACHNQAYFIPEVEYKSPTPQSYIANTTIYPSTNRAYTTITPYQHPYQSLGDAFGQLGATFENLARREKFMNNCMVANGWKSIEKADTALTVSTYAEVGEMDKKRTVYEGTATGYLDGTGTIKLKSDQDDVCVGQFRYTTSQNGTGVVRCDSGDSAQIQFTALSSTSGYGSGVTNTDKMVRFVFGLEGEEREKYMK